MAKIHDLSIKTIKRIAYFVLHKRTLAHGTRVCRAWKMPFQEYLFEHVGFSFQPHERLQRIYSSDPATDPFRDTRLSSIRSVHVWNGRSGDWANHSHTALQHTIIDIKFLPIFQSLNLTSICLTYAPFDWESLSLEEVYAVVNLFRRPMLREVMVDAAMQQAYFPLAILPLCPNIQSFGLRYEEVPHYGQAFPRFNSKIAKLMEVYEKLIEVHGELTEENEEDGNMNTVEDQTQEPEVFEVHKKPIEENEEGEHADTVEDQAQEPELYKLALGPVGATLLQELTLSATAIPIFLGSANAEGIDVNLMSGARLTLNLLERFNPPTTSMDPFNTRGLPLERTIWFTFFHNWGANITELRLHLMRYRAVTKGAYPTQEALKDLVNLKSVDLAIDIQDVWDVDIQIIAEQIENWFAHFLECLPVSSQLVHVGIFYRVLVFVLTNCGVPNLAKLAGAWGSLDRMLNIQCPGIEDCKVVLSLLKSGNENRNVWKDFEYDAEDRNNGSFSSLFGWTHRRCRNLKAIAIADPRYMKYIKGLLD